MPASYKLVFVNLIISFALALGIIIFRFVYPKRNLKPIPLLLLLSALPLVSLLRAGSYESGDLTYNVINSMEYYTSLLEGHILPQWAGISNATYGYPLFIFIYPLPYLVTIFFHVLGISFVTSFKLFIATAFITSAIAMYLWVREEINEKSAIVASIFYMFAPYHLVDMHFRVSSGEIASFAVLPLTFYFARKSIFDFKLRWIFLFATALTLLVLSNQVIALVAFIFISFYILVSWINNKSKKKLPIIYVTLSFVYSLLLSSFFWIPAFFESRFTHAADFVKSQIGFATLTQLLYSPWRYGLLFQGPKGELSFVIGYMHIFIILIAIIYLITNKLTKIVRWKVLFFVVSTFVFCLLMTSYSKLIWDNITILRNFQFTWRLLLFVAFCTSFLAGIVVTKLNNKIIVLLCIITILSSILNWGNRRTIPEIGDAEIRYQMPLVTGITAGLQPAVPKWMKLKNPWFTKIPPKHIEILSGDTDIKPIKRNSTYHSYVILAKSNAYLKENTEYFPGWKAKLNGKEVKINPSNPEFPGVITLFVPKGLYLLEVEFSDIAIVSAAKKISQASFVLLVILFLMRKKLRFLPKL